jgi:hypothetical protein
LQRFSPIIFLFSHFSTFISRFRLARSFFLTIFFFADNMSSAAFAIFIRLAAGQTTIDSGKAFFPLPESRKLPLSGYKIDKTASRLRRG